MSKFVEYGEFRRELKDLKMGYNGCVDQLMSDTKDMSERLENTVKAVNQNADAGMELSKRLDALQKRVEKLQDACKALRVDVDAKNSNGAVTACMVGVLGLFGFIYLASEINKVQEQIDILNKQKAKSAEKTFRESNGSESNADSNGNPESKPKQE